MIHPLIEKEWKSQLNRPSFYLIWGLSAIYLGLQYFFQMTYFSRLSQEMYYEGTYSFLENLWLPYFGHVNMMLLFLSPFLVCRIFNDENKSSTLLLIKSMPIRNFSLVWNKFLAGFSMVFAMVLLGLSFPLVSYLFLPENPILDLMFCFLALVLASILYSSISLFASSFLSSYLLSGFIAICLNLGIWSVVSLSNDFWGNKSISLQRFWIGEHFSQIMLGNIALDSVFFFLGLSFLFLFLSYQLVDEMERL